MTARPFSVVSFAWVLLTAPAFAQSGVRWTTSFDEALKVAQAEKKVLLLAFNMAGERANDEMVADHYKDPTLGRLSQHTVNVFCSLATEPRVQGVTPAQQQAAERAARSQVLKIGPGEDVIAPQHVFVGPDGAVLSSVPYRVTKGELEWAWVDAIKKVDARFAWEASPGARAPARLGFGSVERGQNRTPPTKDQVEEALREVKKARGGIWRALPQLEVLMRSDLPEALQFVQATLNGLQPEFVRPAIDTMGMVSPRAYHAVISPYLSDRDEKLRQSAAGALERLAEPKAHAPLLKQLKVEKADPVRCRLLRAVASCGPTHKETIAQIDKALSKDPSAEVRAHAVLALALVEDRTKVQEGLIAALRDGSAKVRATVAFAMASRRDAVFADKLEAAATIEEEADTKAWLEEAAKVVRGGDGRQFDKFLQRVLGEETPRAGLGGGGRGGG